MLTRIRLRRTKSSLNSLSNNANENHHLRYGEALYSFADNMMVVGTETDQVISNIPNRIIAFPKVTKNVIFAGPTSGSAAFPTFRALVAADIPTGIPASKITGIQTYSAGAGISISNAGVISNSGVRSVATGSTNGTIQVNTNGTTSNVAVKGLGSAAYQPTTAFQAPLKTLTFNDSGSGSASAVNYNGNAAMTISYNTIGAASSSHTHIVNLATTSSTSAELGVTGLLSVSNGGTGRKGFVNPNAVVISNPSRPTTGAVYQIQSNSGAFYSTGQDVQPGFGTLPVAQGGTGKTTFTNKNSVIVANASTGDGILNSIRSTSGAFYSTGTDSTPQFGTLPVAQGGTGKASWTANQLVYATATNALGQLAPAQANQVIMSDANKKPTWSDPSNLIASALDNFKIWEKFTRNTGYVEPEYSDLLNYNNPITLGDQLIIGNQPCITIFSTLTQPNYKTLRLSNPTVIEFPPGPANYPPDLGYWACCGHQTPKSIPSNYYFVIGNYSTTLDIDYSNDQHLTLYKNTSSSNENVYIFVLPTSVYNVYQYAIGKRKPAASRYSGSWYYDNTTGGMSTNIKQINDVGDWHDNSTWSQIINPESTLTHGMIDNYTSVQLYRGTLANTLYKNKQFTYVGTGYSRRFPTADSQPLKYYYDVVILDIFGNFGYIPKQILITGDEGELAPWDSIENGHNVYWRTPMSYRHIQIDTSILWVGNFHTPNPTYGNYTVTNRIPLFTPYASTPYGGIRWVNAECKKIALWTRTPTEDQTSDRMPSGFNDKGRLYTVTARNEGRDYY